MPIPHATTTGGAAITKPSAAGPPRSSSAPFVAKKGTTVRVRTRVGRLPTGQWLVLWLSAVIVSAAEEGYLEVIYNGDFPRDDPFRTVRVARDQVKNMPPPPPPAKCQGARRPLQPTVAGKKSPAVQKRLQQMQSSFALPRGSPLW